MRARNIKPSLFKNEVLGTADPMLSLLFISLWCIADKAGRLEDRPLRIKAETFPYRDGIDVNGYLTELERLGFIQRYQVDGRGFIQVVNFDKHQHPHHTEKASEFPECPVESTGCALTVKPPLANREIPEALRLIPDSLIPDSLIPDSLIPDSYPSPDGEGVGSASGDSPEPTARINGYHLPPTDSEAVVAAYHEILPSLSRVVSLTPARKAAIRQRWREVCVDSKLDAEGARQFFRDYWTRVSRSEFLMGKGRPAKDREAFVATFDWLIAPRNFIKVIEGNYDPKRRAA